MAQLYDEGYRNLCGVDASGSALELFANEYPQVFQVADIRHDLFQRYLMNFATNAVDYVYSNGATIELVHPSFPIVSEICRVARSGVLLDLSERNQGYPRDYVAQFRKSGFDLTYSNKAEFPENKSHIFVFTRNSLKGVES
jgi:SAM-dependent methyltransferase